MSYSIRAAWSMHDKGGHGKTMYCMGPCTCCSILMVGFTAHLLQHSFLRDHLLCLRSEDVFLCEVSISSAVQARTRVLQWPWYTQGIEHHHGACRPTESIIYLVGEVFPKQEKVPAGCTSLSFTSFVSYGSC